MEYHGVVRYMHFLMVLHQCGATTNVQAEEQIDSRNNFNEMNSSQSFPCISHPARFIIVSYYRTTKQSFLDSLDRIEDGRGGMSRALVEFADAE